MMARPTPVVVPASVGQLKAAPKASYLEMVEHLETSIQEQLAAVKAVMDSKGLGPDDVQFAYAIDITGKEISVCLACGIVGHDYQPTMVRQENPEIDMLNESLVVFLEVASRLGVAHALVAYDDTGVLTLRPMAAPATATERGQLSDRFQKFRNRFAKVMVGGQLRPGMSADPAWVKAEAAVWKPSDATRKVAGEPDDRAALDEIHKLYAAYPIKAQLRGATFAKSQVPASSLKSFVGLSAAKDIKLSGIAVGKDAAQIKASFFGSTEVAPTMHDLRKHIGGGIKRLVDQAKDKE
jgi:hypothetical protein